MQSEGSMNTRFLPALILAAVFTASFSACGVNIGRQIGADKQFTPYPERALSSSRIDVTLVQDQTCTFTFERSRTCITG